MTQWPWLPQWRRPQPELVIHDCHPKAEDLHQLALALVVLVGPCEPRGGKRKGPWMTWFRTVKSGKIWGKFGEKWENRDNSWKWSVNFGDFGQLIPISCRLCPWFIILFYHSLSQIEFPVLFHNIAKKSSHAFVFLVVLAELRHLEFAMPQVLLLCFHKLHLFPKIRVKSPWSFPTWWRTTHESLWVPSDLHGISRFNPC